MIKFFNILLILVILIGGVRLAMRGQEYRAFAQERVQLVRKMDGFHVRDQSKYLIQFVENDDPKLFRWRIYTPGLYKTRALSEFGRSNFFYDDPRFGPSGKLMSMSLRFDFIDEDLYVDTQYSGGGTRTGKYDAKLAAFLEQHWRDIEIDVLGKGEPVEIAADQIVKLLSIAISDELFAELKGEYGDEMARRFSQRRFFRFSYGERALLEQFQEHSQNGER